MKMPEMPSVDELVRKVQALSVSDSLNVRMTVPHFRQRLSERNIDMRSILEVLRYGNAGDRPTLDEFGDWRITMRRKVAGRRIHVTVAVCAEHIECITAW